MKKLIHDIHKGKNIKENLKHYSELAIRTYADYGTLEMTFSAYTLLDEEVYGDSYSGEKQEILQRVKRALGTLGEENCDYAALMEEMKKFREEITGKMDLLTAYTDRMICYEYVLNRMELRYLPEKELAAKLAMFQEEEYMKMLQAYLFGSKDEKVTLDKLRLVMGQIPVHMTKGKLFERIGETLTLYQDGDQSALDSFLYMLRTSAMLYEPEQYVGQYLELERTVDELEQADYENLTQKQYEKLATLLENGAKEIHEITDFYYGVQNVVNGIYALCIILPYDTKGSRIEKAGKEIWSHLAVGDLREEMLTPLEGCIEECVEKSSYLESVLYEIRSSYRTELEETGLTELFRDFVLVANLLSDSLFIDLSVGEEEKKVDSSYVHRCTNELLDELSEKFSQVSRPVKRAIMGQIL